MVKCYVGFVNFGAVLGYTRNLMPQRKRKKKSSEILSTVRKPTAPPSRKFGENKAEDKAHPSLRGVKHKKKVEKTDGDL